MGSDAARLGTTATAGTLAGLAGLHVAWGLGASFPCSDRETLADTIAGTSEVPGKRACFAVAGALLVAAGFVTDLIPVNRRVRTPIVAGAAATLVLRGAAGLAQKTSLLVPWTTSERFDRLDSCYYGPLCLALAAGAVRSVAGR